MIQIQRASNRPLVVLRRRNGEEKHMGIYNVHGGHNSIVPGASKYLNEVTEDRKVKNKVIELLRAAGHTVYDCTDDLGRTQSQNLANIVAKCNAHSVDYDISIHLNAGGGTGTEVLYYPTSSKGKAMAEAMSKRVADALRLKNRGAKSRSDLYVLKRTKAPAVLVECCFVDSATDRDKWNVDACAKAIVEAVTGKTVSSGTSSNTSSSAPIAQTKADQLKVDGKWGQATTLRLQKIFGTVQDGVVSYQREKYRQLGCYTGWQWVTNPSGSSDLIKAIQRLVGAKVDGWIGPKTIRAMQKYWGTVQDGKISAVSDLVKAIQRWANSQAS